jgi:hypothetical protein
MVFSRLPTPLPIVALEFAMLLAAVACSEKDSNQPTSSASTAPADAQCIDYCEALVQADCTGAVTGDCADTCTSTIDSLGSCVESWRTMTQCLIEDGFTCTDTGAVMPADGCLEAARQHRECLETGADAGAN